MNSNGAMGAIVTGDEGNSNVTILFGDERGLFVAEFDGRSMEGDMNNKRLVESSLPLKVAFLPRYKTFTVICEVFIPAVVVLKIMDALPK